VKKLLEIGGYLNKEYHVFINNNFMSVPFVHYLHQLSTYITGTVRRNMKHLSLQFIIQEQICSWAEKYIAN
jgi:hypothetical protein